MIDLQPTMTALKSLSADLAAPPVTGSPRVLIVANDRTPPGPGTGSTGASVWVAERYAAARGIPLSNICHVQSVDVNPPGYDGTNITMAEYQRTIEPFVRAAVLSIGTSQVDYIVTTYGIPTTIPELGSGTSIDYRLGSLLIAGRTFITGRLDGPTPAITAGLVGKAIAAEALGGNLTGTSYFDVRGLPNDPNDGYAIADQTVRKAEALVRLKGFATVLNDQTHSGARIRTATNCLFGFGWYSNWSIDGLYTFAPGGMAAQLTSQSAEYIRQNRAGKGDWCAYFLEQGVTATWGAVTEPGVSGFPMPDVVFGGLFAGKTLGQAFAAAPSRENIVLVGDPLYQPFRRAI